MRFLDQSMASLDQNTNVRQNIRTRMVNAAAATSWLGGDGRVYKDQGLHPFRARSPETAPSATSVAETTSSDKDYFHANESCTQYMCILSVLSAL